MFIQFQVAHYASIGTEQTLSAVAHTVDDLQYPEYPQHVFSSDFDPTLNLVPVLAIYGPNGSGKTQLLKALAWMQHFVTHSSSDDQAGALIPLPDGATETPAQPAQFTLRFSVQGVRYEYGFIVNSKQVLK